MRYGTHTQAHDELAAAQARIKHLEFELARIYKHDGIAELEGRIYALKAALLKYGGHRVICAYVEREAGCDCGWEVALRGNDGTQ